LRQVLDTDIELTPLTEKWNRNEITDYIIMLKTLQQARMEGIWKPCLQYRIKWNGESYVIHRSSKENMNGPLDVGVLMSSKGIKGLKLKRYFFNREKLMRLFPSTRVREIQNGSILAAIGFPSTTPINESMKSHEELVEVYPFKLS
jgi:hypothetical protein